MRVNPFTLVAATRYAIRRNLTGAAEMVANDVLLHADEIRTDQGATMAIVHEIDELERLPADTSFGTAEEWRSNVTRWQRVRARLLAEPRPPKDAMDLGWNEPAPATQEEFVELLGDMLAVVRANESFEGFVQYTMPVSDPWEEERAKRDPRWAEASFGVMARYRVGNSMGQGGLAAFTKPREFDGAGEA